MKPALLILLPALLLVTMGPALAHEPMGHACATPLRPADDQNDARWQAFLADIDRYRACVNAKKDWHEAAVAEHQQAARQVVEAWNAFVRTSLNAPEDFPWPPE